MSRNGFGTNENNRTGPRVKVAKKYVDRHILAELGKQEESRLHELSENYF